MSEQENPMLDAKDEPKEQHVTPDGIEITADLLQSIADILHLSGSGELNLVVMTTTHVAMGKLDGYLLDPFDGAKQLLETTKKTICAQLDHQLNALGAYKKVVLALKESGMAARLAPGEAPTQQ